MTTPTQPVTCRFFDQDGSPIAAKVSFKLTNQEIYNGIIVGPQADYVICDASTGIGVISLFPNALGANSSQYTVKAIDSVTGRKILAETVCTIPDSPCYLDLILNQEPFPTIDAAGIALAGAQAATALATTQADIATAQASISVTQAGIATAQAVISTAKAVLTAADSIATAADRVATGLDRGVTTADKAQTTADRAQTGLDRIATAADAVLTHADVASIAFSEANTAADRVQTGLDRIAAADSAVASSASKDTSTAQANIATTQAGIAVTNANTAIAQAITATTQAGIATDKAALTAADAIATAADRVQTNADVVTTAGLVTAATTQANLATTNGAAQVALATTQAGLATTNGQAQVTLATAQAVIATDKAVLTAADRTQTGLDRIQTAADRVQTGLDRVASAATITTIAASAAAANTSAGAASGSAASALAVYGTSNAMAAALATAQAQASAAAGSALSASSVLQQDLSAVNAGLHRSPNAVTAMFVYDTSKDSDGGAWTEKCQHTSWYNEAVNGAWRGQVANEAAARAISGATTGDYFQLTTDGKFYKLNAGSGVTEVFRGNKHAFPKLAGIVAEAGSVTIYDLTEAGCPMWRSWHQVRDYSGKLHDRWALAIGSGGSGTVTCIATNSIIMFGQNQANPNSSYGGGIYYVDLIKDKTYSRQGTYGVSDGLTLNSVADFYSGTYIRNTLETTDNGVQFIAAIVLPDAPIDPVAGLAVPTIAVFTGLGISLIRDNGTVINSSSTTAFTKGTIDAKQIMGINSTGALVSAKPRSLGASFALTSYTAASTPALMGIPTRTSRSSSLCHFSNSTGVTLLKENIGTTAKGAIARIGKSFNSGWQLGDIRRAYLADIGAGSVSGASLLTGSNSIFDIDTGAWTTWAASPSTISRDTSIFSSGALKVVSTGNYPIAAISIPMVIGQQYLCKSTVNSVTGGVILMSAANSASVSARYASSGGYGQDFIFTATASTTWFFIWGSTNTVGATFYVDEVSVKAIVPDRSYKASAAPVFGTLTKTEVALAAQTVAYSGFSAANYLRESYSADLDFGTGEWSVGAWVNVPVSLPTTYPVVGSELLTNGTFDTDTAGWTVAGCTASVSGGLVTIVPGGGYGTFSQSVSTQIGKVYRVKITRQGNAEFSISVNGAGGISGVPPVATREAQFVATSTTTTINITTHPNWGTLVVDSISTTESSPFTIVERSFGATGSSIKIGVLSGLFYFGATDNVRQLIASVSDGTTTRTVTTTAAYNTATWAKAEATYKAGKLAITVNGVEVASTVGAPLLILNNADAVLTIGNSYALDAPFPGSIALLKIGATVPTQEQAAWMYEQEKHMFTAGAQVCLPDANAIVDLAYDDATDKWIAVSTTNESEWSGLIRTSTKAVPSGAYSKVSATSGVKMCGRTTTTPGVDIEIPAYGLREQVLKRNQRQDTAVFDYLGGFTATTNITAGTSYNLTAVASSLYPVSYVGAVVTGSGIPATTSVVGVSGTTIYLDKAATLAASLVQISFTDFILPVGYEAKMVYVDGVMKYEGATKDYTRLFDGFKETIRFGVAPAYNTKVQIHAVRSAA